MLFNTFRKLTGVAVVLATLVQVVVGFITRADYYYRTDRPLLIAHRGTWGKYPEHSLGAWIDSYYAGVDFIEFDI